MRLTVVKAVTPVTALRAPRTEKRCRATAPPTQNLVVDGFWWNEGLVSPQDTYEAGPNVNEVLPPNPGTNILTTTHIQYLYIVIHNMCIYIYTICCTIHFEIYTCKDSYTHEATWVRTHRQRNQNNRRNMYHVVRKGSECRQRIQNFGVDLTRRLGRSWQQDSMQKPMETLWRRCGEKGVQVYWTRTYQERISMLLILACSTDCTVAKLFRSNHFDMFCLSNLMRWKGQHHSVQRRGRSPRQRHWLWGVMTRIVMPVVASIWV